MDLRCVIERCLALMLCAFGLLGCASQSASVPSLNVLGKSEKATLIFTPKDKSQWEILTLPGKLRTEYKLAHREGQAALQAVSQSSASMLRQRLNVAPDQLGRLQFQWMIEDLIFQADMRERESEDSPVRLILAFDGDRSQFSAKNAMLSELSRALTGEEMPYATLMYVWSNQLPVGTVIINPRTDRVRKIVVESGPQRLKQWLRYERQIRADFEKAFGEPPGPLIGLAIMTDTDNTQGQARAWYGDIRLD